MAQHKRQSEIKLLEDHLSIVEYLGDILEGARQNAIHIDNQVNILVGLSTAMFLFAVTQIKQEPFDFVFLILSITAAIAVILSLLAIHPPRFARKRGQPESLMYNKHIVNLKSYEEYWKRLGPSLSKRHEMARQYTLEIYNLYRYYYRPKRRLFHWSRNVLIYGIGLAAIAFATIHFTTGI